MIGTIYENVEVVATDPLNDIAFLKVRDISGLKAAMLGDSKTLSVGQQVQLAEIQEQPLSRKW